MTDKNAALSALEKIRVAVMTASGTFAGYEILHMAKTPPDVEKAKRNGDMDKMLLGLAADLDTVKAALSSPSPAVDVSRVHAEVERLRMELLEIATGAQVWDRDEIIEYAERVFTESKALPAMREAWQDGYPEKPYCNKWFIAVTTYGDKVVLKALPEDYSYDFTTADDTYIKKEKIKKWMPFPHTDEIEQPPSKEKS